MHTTPLMRVERPLPIPTPAAAGTVTAPTLEVEYKVVAGVRNHHIGAPATATATAAGATAAAAPPAAAAVAAVEWHWQPGANRRVCVARGGSGSGSGAPVAVYASWYHHRDGTEVIAADPYLEPQREALAARYAAYTAALARIEALPGGLDAFSRGWHHFGFTRGTAPDGTPGIQFREWAPGARAMSLVGDFNGWNADATPCTRDDFVRATCFAPLTGITRCRTTTRPLKPATRLVCAGRVLRVPARRSGWDAGNWAQHTREAVAAGGRWRPPRAAVAHLDTVRGVRPGDQRVLRQVLGPARGGAARVGA